jgi:arylsulfatase A-like enzyme
VPARVAIPAVLGVALALTAWLIGAATSGAVHRSSPQAKPPNIVLIRTDDQTAAQLNASVMPETTRLLVDRGTRFTQALVATPQCCPSRAATLTGQYGHNNGVTSNFPGYPDLRHKGNTLPVWLREAGYRTAHVGKYLNGYTSVADRPDVAPGWDIWATVPGGASRYYDYAMSVNGRLLHFGHAAADNVTSVLNRKAKRIVARYGDARKPLFLQLDERAPHAADGLTKGRCTDKSPQPVPRDLDRFSDEPLPQPPSFNEADMSDKPPFLRRPELDADRIARIGLHYQCSLASLSGVDRGVRRIFEAFRKLNAIRRTVFIFTSDNGFFRGEHRIGAGKSLSYEESIRVPLVVRLPGPYRRRAPRVAEVSRPVANIDLAPTILALAGADPCRANRCRTMDGRSLLPLLRGKHPRWSRNRGILTEYSNLDRPRDKVCAYSGLRLARRMYVEYSSVAQPGQGCQPADGRELYELHSDPFELENVADRPDHQAEVAKLSERLARLRKCAGIAGRDRRVGRHPFCE